MKKIMQVISDLSTDRLKNPFIFAFIISWVVINWKAIFIVFFSNEIIENKILSVEIWHSTLWLNVYLPLIMATFYLLILPYLMLVFDKISNKALKNRKDNLFNLKSHDINGKIKIAKQEMALEELKLDFKEKSSLNKKINQLESTIEKKETLIETFKSQSEKLSEDNIKLRKFSTDSSTLNFTEEESDSFLKEYLKFQSSDYYTYFMSVGSEVSQRNSIPNIDEIIIEKYIYSEIIRKVIDKEQNAVDYVFTRKGRYFWKEFVSKYTISEPQHQMFEDNLPF
jgi:hypothetical protein